MSYGFHELRKKFNWALALGFLSCCVVLAQNVTTSHVPGIDFSKYHTYTWVVIKGGEHPDPSVDAHIKQLIDSQLAAKGLTKTAGAADLGVDYQLAVSKVQTWQTYEDWGSAAPGDARLPMRKKVTIDKGTLVIDIYDMPAKHLVWTGDAKKTIDPNSSREAKQKIIDKAVKALLGDFPPQ